MASESQTRYMFCMACAAGIAKIMDEFYQEKPGRETMKKYIRELHDMGISNLGLAHGYINPKEEETFHQKLDRLKKNGLENVKSYQTYISMLIGILSEREQEIAACAPNSKKIKCLSEMVSHLEKMYSYFYNRTRSDRLDEHAAHLLDLFNTEMGIS